MYLSNLWLNGSPFHCLFPDRFFIPKLLYSVITRAFLYKSVTNMLASIYTTKEPYFSAQVWNRFVAMQLYCVALHFVSLLMWYAYLRMRATQLQNIKLSGCISSCSKLVYCFPVYRTVLVNTNWGPEHNSPPGDEGEHTATLWLIAMFQCQLSLCVSRGIFKEKNTFFFFF